ncbi:MAG: HlyC/CorC family transporter [Thermotogae bacterium]|nr:HlyC/CorC family transporter [Thermotogota bacterium]
MFFKKNELDKLLDDIREKVKEKEKENLPERRREEIDDLIHLLKGVLRVSGRTTEEVMKPRVDVVMVSANDTLQDLVDKFLEHRYSRYPVLSKMGDTIVGIAHIKDVFQYIDRDLNTISVEEIAHKPLFVPAAQGCLRTLRKLQDNRTPMAMVVDEYGSVIGIVTVEDLLEEIVGEIYEEHDKEENKYIKLGENEYLFNAWVPISEVEELLNVDLGDTESTSIGGFVIEKLGGLPEVGKVIRVNGVEIETKDVEPQRIRKVIVRKVAE